MRQFYIRFRSDKYYHFAPRENDKKNNAVFNMHKLFYEKQNDIVIYHFIFHKIIVRTLKISWLETCRRKTRTIPIWRLYYEKYVHLTILRVSIRCNRFAQGVIATCGRYKVPKVKNMYKNCTVVLFGSAKTPNGWLSEIPLVELMV